MLDYASSSPGDGLLSPGTQLGEYTIERVLSSSAMATVYTAVHPILGKRAAIKVISHALSRDAVAVSSFLHEALSINEIHHPNIVDVFAFSALPDGRSYFVMEWLGGETLRARLQRCELGARQLSLAESCDVLTQVCEALEAAHGAQIVHLDLKPEHVQLVPVHGGRVMVKLLDFGIAKHFRAEDTLDVSFDETSRSNLVVGTPAYMSPEQARGEELLASSDVYSLGVMAYELFVGEPPFASESTRDLLLQHVTTPAPSPRLRWPQMPMLLEQLLLHMLAKNPQARPTLAMVREWLGMLRDAHKGPLPAPAAVARETPTARVQRIAAPRRRASSPLRHRVASVVALSLSALLVAAGLVYFAGNLPAQSSSWRGPTAQLSVANRVR